MTCFPLLIVLDFDGTVVKHRYPCVGEDIGAVPVLQCLVRNGHHLLLSTMRSRCNDGRDTLQPAIDWFEHNGLPLYGVNENPDQHIWTESPKVYGDIIIDDTALGAPLRKDSDDREYIDWVEVACYLYSYGALSADDMIQLGLSDNI